MENEIDLTQGEIEECSHELWNERALLTPPETYVSELQRSLAKVCTGLIEKGAVTVTARMSQEKPGFLEIIFCHERFVYKTVRNMRQINDYRDNGQLVLDIAIMAQDALRAIIVYRTNELIPPNL